jgi:hypothetical protein
MTLTHDKELDRAYFVAKLTCSVSSAKSTTKQDIQVSLIEFDFNPYCYIAGKILINKVL